MTTSSPDIIDYRIGLTSGSMASLDSIPSPSGSGVVSVTPPKSTFTPYSDEQQLVSGLVRGVGYPKAVWIWNVLTREERDALRQYCPGKSANVYIKTKTMDSSDSYHTYAAVMVWPTQEEQRDFQRRLEFKITFQTLVFVS